MIETDERVIVPDAEQYNASLVRREDATESLATFWVRFDGDATPFESGQYMTIGVFAEDASTPTGRKIVQRPYSVASDPGVAATDGSRCTFGSSRAGCSRRCSGGSRSATGCG